MSDDDLLLDDWRTNYGLHDKSPGEAAQWWHDNLGYVPVGAVAALGTAIEMIEKLRAALAEKRVPLTEEQRRKLWRESEFRGSGGQLDWFIEGTRAAERAHGIGEQR